MKANEMHYFSAFLVKNSIYLGQTYCPSSEVLIRHSQQIVFVMLVMLTVCWRGQCGTDIASRQST